MTSRQWSILLALLAANVLLVCCVAPSAFLLLTQPDQYSLQAALNNLQAALPAPAQPTAAPTPTLAAGWKLYTVASDHFALALPPSWKQVPLSQVDAAAQADVFGKKNPELAGAPNASIASLLKFVGVDTAPAGTVDVFSTNINVFHRTEPIAAPLDVYVPISLKALQDLPYVSKPVLHRRVETLAGAAEEFRYSNNLKLPDNQTITTANREYVLVRGKEFFVITGAAPIDQENQYAPIFGQIAASFRWTGN